MTEAKNGNTRLEVLFTPADFEALTGRDLSGTVCVVFDVLRATSSMITALSNGAREIIPVATIEEAVAWRERMPALLLGGERDGLRITRELTGSVDFDLGNSPREFTPEIVKNRTVVMTTTNGTRALRACAQARTTYVASFLNLGATAKRILQQAPPELLLVCSGTFEEAAYEDLLAAGALCQWLWNSYSAGKVADSALIALKAYAAAAPALEKALGEARNGKRLLSRPDLAADVAYCARQDAVRLVAALNTDGSVTTI